MSPSPAENQYRRTLPRSEADILRNHMTSAWDVDTDWPWCGDKWYWWPLCDTRPPHAEAFKDYCFEHEFGYVALRRILAEHGITTVFEFCDNWFVYEVSLAAFEPRYTRTESFWTTDRFDWVIYASHENTVTVAGEWLLPAVQAAWPQWERRVWDCPSQERTDVRPDIYVDFGTYPIFDARPLLEAFVTAGIDFTVNTDSEGIQTMPPCHALHGGLFGTQPRIAIRVHPDDLAWATALRRQVLKIML